MNTLLSHEHRPLTSPMKEKPSRQDSLSPMMPLLMPPTPLRQRRPDPHIVQIPNDAALLVDVGGDTGDQLAQVPGGGGIVRGDAEEFV